MKEKRVAADIMTSPVISAKRDTLLIEAIRLLLRWNVSGLPVVDENDELVGIITEYDVLKFSFSGYAKDTTVDKAMTTKVVSFPMDADIETLISCFASTRVRRVPIVENDKVIGLVSRRDILRELEKVYSKY
ncbi:MAG: CBS domain-containing protein [Candidatus Theseobacter exili]|nr:CBS domain-containing protein [Candidatus Theseobacter exili]